MHSWQWDSTFERKPDTSSENILRSYVCYVCCDPNFLWGCVSGRQWFLSDWHMKYQMSRKPSVVALIKKKKKWRAKHKANFAIKTILFTKISDASRFDCSRTLQSIGKSSPNNLELKTFPSFISQVRIRWIYTNYLNCELANSTNGQLVNFVLGDTQSQCYYSQVVDETQEVSIKEQLPFHLDGKAILMKFLKTWE